MSSFLSFSKSHLFLLHLGPSFLHFSLHLPLDQILCPRPCLDVRPYMFASTIFDSHPMSWEIDLLFYIWQVYFIVCQGWLLSFCQCKLCYYNWQFLPMFCIILCTWWSSSLLGVIDRQWMLLVITLGGCLGRTR